MKIYPFGIQDATEARRASLFTNENKRNSLHAGTIWYRRIHVFLKREGCDINYKRVYRIYREEGLNIWNKSKRKRISVRRVPEINAICPLNEYWCMDFVSDQLYNESDLGH